MIVYINVYCKNSALSRFHVHVLKGDLHSGAGG